MAQPGDSVSRAFRVLDTDDQPVTGLTAAEFWYYAFTGAALHSTTFSLSEYGLGFYFLTITLPSPALSFSQFFDVVNDDYTIMWANIDGEVEAYDLGTIYTASSRPVSLVTGGSAPTNNLNLRVVAGDTVPITVQITNRQTGDPYLLDTEWQDYGLGIRPEDVSSWNDEIDGARITVDDSGNVTATRLIGDNHQSYLGRHYWDFQATHIVGGYKQTLARGTFEVLRQEYQQ